MLQHYRSARRDRGLTHHEQGYLKHLRQVYSRCQPGTNESFRAQTLAEVGIGVLLVFPRVFRQQNLLDSSAVEQSMTIGALSLALNLALTGVFITAVIRLR